MSTRRILPLVRCVEYRHQALGRGSVCEFLYITIDHSAAFWCNTCQTFSGSFLAEQLSDLFISVYLTVALKIIK